MYLKGVNDRLSYICQSRDGSSGVYQWGKRGFRLKKSKTLCNKHETSCLITFRNAVKRVANTTRSGEFFMNLEAFGSMVKNYCLECSEWKLNSRGKQVLEICAKITIRHPNTVTVMISFVWNRWNSNSQTHYLFIKFKQRKSRLQLTVFGYLILIRIYFYDLSSPFSPYFSFDWEDISNIQDNVWPHFQTPRSLSKILRYSSYFQFPSRCLEMWSNTVFCVWYITWVWEGIGDKTQAFKECWNIAKLYLFLFHEKKRINLN